MIPASLTGVDSAGGGLLLAGASHPVTIGGVRAAVTADPVASHGSGPHSSATIAAGSTFVTVNGLALAFGAGLASCGHTTTGSAHVTLSS